MHTPSWFKKEEVLVVNAETCGINKDGNAQYLVNPTTGIRSSQEIDDSLAECCDAIVNKDFSRKEIFYTKYSEMIQKDIYVPKFYDTKTLNGINSVIKRLKGFSLKSLKELLDDKSILLFGGHGSPSSDQRLGTIPYIKVSDLRAGHVNINPTNMVPIELAKKNIGEFCVLMPGQENAVFTKEVIVIRSNNQSLFDQFYLMWALSLKEVREQWERIVFMQTNREDVGKRILEIRIPIPNNIETANKYSKSFKEYYNSLETSRNTFIKSLKDSKFEHHIYLGD